jgi:hypothetical protein
LGINSTIKSGLESGAVSSGSVGKRPEDHVLKDALIAYNRQDCEALKIICEFLRKSTVSASVGENIPGGNAEVVSAETLRKVGDGNRPVSKRSEFVCPEFAFATVIEKLGLAACKEYRKADLVRNGNFRASCQVPCLRK